MINWYATNSWIKFFINLEKEPEIVEITLKEFFFGGPDFIGIYQLFKEF